MEGDKEKVLSDFISRTNTDPGFAQDLLEATGWNIEAATAAFNGLNVTNESHHYEKDTEFTLDEYDEIILEEEEAPPIETAQQEVKKRSLKKRKTKGLASVAEEISDIFLRNAVSETKLKAGEEQKEKVFDEQFFKHSFLRPDFSKEKEDLQKFIDADITENSHKHILEKSGRLNWWSSTGKLPTLEPLATSGDGNCLLHAASMYMWGLPDINLILRTHLHRILTRSLESDAIHRRWKYSTELHNEDAGGLVFSEEEWDFEWHEIVRIATNKPRRRPTTNSLKRYSTLRPHYESLEEIHVFGLAHVIRRPVIVIADEFIRNMDGEPLAPVYFGGIYLPLEISHASCFKSPLILAYESSHFSPLVAKKDTNLVERHKNSRFRHMQSKQDTVIPLVTPDGSLLPLLFPYDPKQPDFPQKWTREKCPPGEFPDEIRTLLESYMDIRWIQLDIGSKFGCHNEVSEEGSLSIPVKVPKVRFPAAVVSNIGEKEYQSQLVVKYLEEVKKRYEEDKLRQDKMATDKARQLEEMKRIEAARPRPCKGEGCTLFGTAVNDYYCSQCYAKYSKGTTPSTQQKSVPPPVVKQTTPPELIIKPQSDDTDSSPSTNDIIPSQGKHQYPVSTNDKIPSIEEDTVLPKVPLKMSKQVPSKTIPTTTKPVNDSYKVAPAVPSKTTPITPPKTTPSNNIPSSAIPPKTTPIIPPKTTPSSNIPTSKTTTANSSPTKTTPTKAIPPPRPMIPPTTNRRPDIIRSSGVTRGYSRDNIQPISSTVTSNKCHTPECPFHGSKDREGYCSQCYFKKHHPSV